MTNIGNIEIQDLFVGSNNAVGLYFGAVEVWSKDTPQPTSPNTKVKYTAASGLPDWEGDIVGALTSSSIPNRTSAEEVEIGSDVTSIGDNTFRDCSRLTSITMGDGVTSIGNSVFWGCTGLSSLSIGNGVTSIGSYTFYSCTGLESVTIPESVTSIGSNAFQYCSGLTGVTFSGKTKATVQGMTNYRWTIRSACVIHCTDGDIT